MDFVAGEVLLIDKPKGWSSFDVVKKVRWLIKTKKVGHAGTLDPLATGLLILCTGKMTKTIDSIQAQAKEYEVEFHLGATTPSYDAEFPPEHFVDTRHVTRDMVVQAIEAFKGEISQFPPQFSAVKVDGKRAYESARAGKTVDIKARTVTIYGYELVDFRAAGVGEPGVGVGEGLGEPGGLAWGRAVIRCSKGTYIRTLVHDLGQSLGVGGYITELHRTRIGDYRVEDAFTIEGLQAMLAESSL